MSASKARGREVTETGKTCRCGDLSPWDAVKCHCGRLFVTVKPRGCGDCRSSRTCARCLAEKAAA